MCGCNASTPSKTAVASAADDAIVLSVEDMTCGHCAGRVKAAIETDIPGASVAADPQSRRVTITGTKDVGTIRRSIAAAGYTPALVGA